MNITEFAKAAGVSKAAVSRYFNGGYLSEEKRARIAAAVEATGYRPSVQAQMLRTRRTRQVGVVLPRLFAVQGIYAAQPAADVLTVLVCLFSIKPMQAIASRNLNH